MLKEPTGDGLPKSGYDSGRDTYQAPPEDRANVQVAVSPTSDRLQILEPFEAWDKKDAKLVDLALSSSEQMLTTSQEPSNLDQGSGQDHH